MTMKRILHCTLIVMVLITSGCDLLFGSDSNSNKNTNSQPTPQVEKNKIDFKGAAQNVENAVTELKSTSNATGKEAKEEIDSAVQKLGKAEDDIAQRCVDCSDETKNGAIAVWKTLKEKSKLLGKDPQKAHGVGKRRKNEFATRLN